MLKIGHGEEDRHILEEVGHFVRSKGTWEEKIGDTTAVIFA